MTEFLAPEVLRKVLSLLFPMQGVVVVGAGHGKGLDDFRAASSLLVIDARADCVAALQDQFCDWPNATAAQAVIADRSEAAAFHLATSPDESGLIPPEQLQFLWRNLKTRSVEQVEACTLVDLLSHLESGHDFHCNWLVIDCLPALLVLEGAGRLLDDVDVVELRCVFDQGGAGVQRARLAETAQWLAARGFCLLTQSEEFHPLVGKAFFCRDVNKQRAHIADVESDLTQMEKIYSCQVQAVVAEQAAKAEAFARCDSLAQAKIAADRLAAERQAQLEVLTAEHQQLCAARDSLSKDKAALTVERDGLAKEKQTLSAERNMLAQAKVAADRLAAERQAQLEALTAEYQQLCTARDALTKDKAALTAERDGLAKEKQAVVKEFDTLKKQKKEFSSDADIDDFISDIAPFFLNRSITYVDVGAFTGEVFTKLLTAGKIKVREAHLIEPNPESFRQLKEAVKGSNITSCNTYQIAISSTPGVAKFKAARSMTKKVLIDLDSEDAENVFEADCRRLDEVASFFTDGRVHLMKLDVEGEELDVIRSAETLFKGQKIDVLYVEAGFNRSGTQQTYFGDLDALLQDYGYRVFKIYEQKNEWIDDSPLLRRCNAAYMSIRFGAANSYKRILSGKIA